MTTITITLFRQLFRYLTLYKYDMEVQVEFVWKKRGRGHNPWIGGASKGVELGLRGPPHNTQAYPSLARAIPKIWHCRERQENRAAMSSLITPATKKRT